MHWAALGVVCLFALAGVRLIMTFRHNNDLRFTFPALTRLASSSDEVPGLDTGEEAVNEDQKYSSPALVLTVGVSCALFAVVTLLVPAGVGLASILHL